MHEAAELQFVFGVVSQLGSTVLDHNVQFYYSSSFPVALML